MTGITDDGPGSWVEPGPSECAGSCAGGVPQPTFSCCPGEIASGSAMALFWAIDCHETPCADATELRVSPLATV